MGCSIDEGQGDAQLLHGLVLGEVMAPLMPWQNLVPLAEVYIHLILLQEVKRFPSKQCFKAIGAPAFKRARVVHVAH